MCKCKVLDLSDTNVVKSEQSVLRLNFMIKRDSKVSSSIWNFSENQILLDIGALDAGKASDKSRYFYKEYFLFRKI